MRRVALVGMLALAALAATGCGDTVSLNPVARAAEQTRHVGGERVKVTGSIDTGGTQATYTANGVFDNRTNSGRMSMTFDTASLGSMEIISEGFVYYMRGSVFDSLLPAGKHWVKFDLAKAGREYGIDLSQVTSADPTAALTQLEKGSSQIETVGHERVGGVTTTHYRAQVDPAKAGLSRKYIDEFQPQYDPVDVWIDHNQYVRRETISFSIAAGGKRFAEKLQMDLSDFNTHADVQPPPDDEVVDLAKLSG